MPSFSKKRTKAVKPNLSNLQDLDSILPVKIQKDTEYHCLSVGQYNLIDIIEKVVDLIGVCDIDLAVWTAATASLKKAELFLTNKSVKNMRWIIDPSFKSRKPNYVKTLRESFGNDCVRTIPTHAKFILIYNKNYNVIIQTSMNLNQNKRLESFTIIESKELVDFYRDFVGMVFEKKDSLKNYGSQSQQVLFELFETDDKKNGYDW